MTTRRLTVRSRRALALEPRILLDAAAVTTAAELSARAVAPTVSAPGVEATPVNSTVTITDTSDSFPAVDLFSNVTVSAETGGTDALNELVISVDSSGANQALVIDGSEIKLETSDGFLSTAGHGYTYSVTVSGGTTSIVLSLASANASASDAQSLIDGIAYKPLDKALESGVVTVTLKSLSDDSDSADLNISASVTLDSRINAAPIVEVGGGLEARETFTSNDLAFANSSEVVYSADGQYAYVAGTGGISAFTVDGTGALSVLQTYAYSDLGSVKHLAMSPDGKSLYAISGNSSIVHLSVGEDGRISTAQTIPTGNGNATGGLAISDDGQYVYVGTALNDVAIYVRDAGTGMLSHLDVNGDGTGDRAPGSGGGSSTRNGVVITEGDHVYVAYGHFGSRVLIAYVRNANGTLSEAASYTFSTSGSAAVDYGLAVSPDGQYLYVGDPENSAIRVFRFSQGELTPVETIAQSVASIALSRDGKTLYATASSGELNIYTVAANGALTLAGSVGTGTQGSDIAVGSDGSLLIAGGNVTRYTAVQTLNLDEPTAFAGGVTLKDSNYDALDGGTGNYRGASLTFSADVTGGSFGFAAGNDLVLSGSSITLEGAAIASFIVDGNGKLTLAFTADTSKAVANQVLRQITYTSATGAIAGSLVTLTVQGSDGVLASNAVTLLLRANEAPQVNAGASTEVGKVTTESAYIFVLPADLFTDAANDKLTWEVTGLPAGLAFDAATRTISGATTEAGSFTLTVKVTDTHGASASRTLDLVVEQIANRAPEVSANAPSAMESVIVGTTGYSVTLDAGLFSDADAVYDDSTLTWSVSELPPGLSFDVATRTLSGTPGIVGDYSIAVTVTDEHGAIAQHTLALRVISQAEGDNHAPVLEAEDIDLVYGVKGDLSGFSQNVYSLALSSDDRSLLIVGSDSAGHTVTPTGNSTLYVYGRDSEGNLSLLQKFVQGASDDGDASNGIEVDGLVSATSAVYSADGQHVYLVGKNSAGIYTLTTLKVGADGTLTATGTRVEIADSSTVRQMAVSKDGNALYVVSNSYLYAYSATQDGSLSLLGSYTDGISSSNALSIANGVVYVAGSSRVAIYTVNNDGSLTHATTWSGGSTFMRSIVATDSGDVYVSRGTSGIQMLHYDKGSNAVTSAIAYSAGQTWGLTLSSDGSALYAGLNGGKVLVFRVNDDGSLTQSATLNTSGAQGLRYAMSSDGSSLYYGSFWNGKGLGQISTTVGATYIEAGTVQPFSNITLSDADYDALANGAGNYSGAILTLQREGAANADDSFGIAEANGLTLENGAILLNGGKIADFSSTDGKLTIFFTAEVSSATANAVLRQISYSSQGNDPGSSIRLILGVKDQFASGTDTLTLALAVTAVNDAPVVSATPISTKQDAGKAFVDLFGNVAVSAVERAQSISRLTLTVSGLRDAASETLRIDGSTVALVSGSGTTASGYAWGIAVDADTGIATVTITHSEGISGEAAAVLIDGMAYANTEQSAATAGERVVTLVEIQDNGGTGEGGVDTAKLSIAATVQVEVGQSPTLGTETGTLEYADLISSSEWPSPYEGIQDVASSGDRVYAVRTAEVWSSDAGAYIKLSTLYVFQRADNGALTLLQSIASTDVAALDGAAEIRVSADGATIYVIGSESVALFARDAVGGELRAMGSFGAELVSAQGLISEVLAKGNFVYVTAGTRLVVFERNGDTLTQKSSYATASEEAQFGALQLSADGQFLFVGTSGGSTLASVYRVASDGSLSFVTAAQGLNPAVEGQYYYTSVLTLSPDGTTLYAADYDGSTYRLYTLTVGADGNLSAVANIDLDHAVKQIIVSDDGAALFVIGSDRIDIHTRAENGAPSLVQTLEGSGGKDFGELRGATLSADGTQLYLAGLFSWNDGLLTLDLKATRSSYTEDGSAVALLPGGTLSDPQLDALNGGAGNYQGASIVLSRTDEGSGGHDVFGFIGGDGLALENGDIKLDGVTIATVLDSGSSFTVTFTTAISRSDAQKVLRHISYSNTSDDPTQHGTQASFLIRFNDGSGYGDDLSAYVTLEGTNDAPVIETHALLPTYKAEGERVKLFEDTVIRTVEAGQLISRITLTLDAAMVGDVLGVDGSRITLDAAISGTRTTGTGLSYNVQIQDGKTIVTLYLMGAPERAAEIIDSLTYGNAGSDLSGTRSISLSVTEYADGNETTVLDTQAVVSLAAAASQNTAPVLAGGASVGYTEQADPVLLAPGVTVSDAQMDAFNGGGGNYDGAVLSITLGEGRSAADTLSFADGNGLTLEGGSLKKDGVIIGSVTHASGELSITFTDANGSIPTTADVQNALRQITYANASDAPSASVAVGVSLSDQRGLVSAALNLTIAISAVNDTPAVKVDPVLSLGELEHVQALTDIAGLGSLSTSTVSADGTRVYLADGQGAIALFSRDTGSGELRYISTFSPVEGGGGIKQLLLSADGSSLYALRADGNAIAQFRLAADGAVTFQATLVSDYAVDGNAFSDIRGIALSEDGENLYLINSYNLVYANRDPASGALRYAGTIEGSMSSAPYLWAGAEIVVRGELIYIVTNASNGSTLLVYQRGEDGVPVILANVHSGEADAAGNAVALNNVQHIAVSADGRTIYVANSRTSSYNGWTGETIIDNHPQQVDAFRLDPATGTLTHLGTITGTQTVEDIAISADGNALFVTLADGSLNYYATGTLALISSQSGLEGAGQISVSADGGVIVQGKALEVLNAPPVPEPAAVVGGAPVLLAPTLMLGDVELDAAAEGAGNYRGASVTFRGEAGDVFGLQVGNGYTLDGEAIKLDGTVVASLTQVNGEATLSFSAALTTSQANALLRQITYTATQGDAGRRTVTLILNDGTADSAVRMVQVSLSGIDDNHAPVAGAADYSLTEARVGERYSLVLPESLFSDADGDPLVWSIEGLPEGLSFDAVTRTLSGIPKTSAELSLIVKVVDPSGASAERSLSLNIAAAELENSAPVVGEADYALTDARAGERYDVVLPESLFSDADGDTLVWSIEGLPEGLSFDAATRTLSGIPKASGEVSLIVKVTDPSGASAERSLSLEVAAAERENSAPIVSETDYVLVDAGAGENYRVVLPESLFSDADGDRLTWRIEGLPEGLDFNAATLTISGSAVTAGSYALSIVVTDPAGASATRMLTLNVQAASVSVVTPAGLPASYFSEIRPGALTVAEAAPESFAVGSYSALGLPADFVARAQPDASLPGHEHASEPLTARATLALLDALNVRQESESAQSATVMPLVDGGVTPLVRLAAADGPTLAARIESLHGTWRADVAGNRQVFMLPPGLFVSREPIVALNLRMADGRPLPLNLRFDIERGLIIRSGLHPTDRMLALELHVQTIDGRSLSIPLTLEGVMRPGERASENVSDGAGVRDQEMGKHALSQHLRERTALDLFAQARAFLATLGDGPAANSTHHPGAVREIDPAAHVSAES